MNFPTPPTAWLARHRAAVTLALLFAVGLLLRLGVVAKTGIIDRDGPYYITLALMINGGSWTHTIGDWFIFNPYPPLIAVFAWTGISYELAGQLACALPAALGLLPLYAWCRSAFDRRVAELAAALYAVHPLLLRTSGQVFREGLYWCCMLTAVWLLWEAVQRLSWWRFLVGGLFATAATLTRVEGAAVWLLAGLWAVAAPRPAGWRWPRLLRSQGTLAAALMFPLTLAMLNWALIPREAGWRGGGRLLSIGARLLGSGTEQAAVNTSAETPSALTKPESVPQAALPPTDVRELADSLPVWQVNGLPDVEQQRLRRLLILADDYRLALFTARFVTQCCDGLQIPVLILLTLGLRWGVRTHWRAARDLPLLGQTLFLLAFCLANLITEHVLEARYLFCLIPFVFPWAAIGMLELTERARDWFYRHGRAAAFRPCLLAAGGILVVAAVGKGFHALDSEKLPQRWLGEQIRATAGIGHTIAGPENLKRVAYYATCTYLILPKGSRQEVLDWLHAQSVDFVVLAEGDHPTLAPDDLRQDPARRFEPVPGDGQRRRIQLFQARGLHQLDQPDPDVDE